MSNLLCFLSSLNIDTWNAQYVKRKDAANGLVELYRSMSSGDHWVGHVCVYDSLGQSQQLMACVGVCES